MTSPPILHPYLRELKCEIPSAFHRGYDDVAAATLEWAERFGLLANAEARRRLARTDCARLGAAVYHDGYSCAALQLATDFMTWLYMHDDLWVDGVRRDPYELDADHRRVLEVLRGGPVAAGDHPLTLALADVRDRLLEFSPQLGPFVDSVEQYLSAKFWESTNHLDQITPDVRVYVQMRSVGGGVVACFEMGCLVRPIQLTSHLRNHAHVTGIAHLANHLVCWANDLASLAKELEEGTTTNLVMAIRAQQRLNWSEAMERAVRMWNDAMRAFLLLAVQLGTLPLADSERRELEKYLVLLASWIRGNLDYDLVVGRFDVTPVPAATDEHRRRLAAP